MWFKILILSCTSLLIVDSPKAQDARYLLAGREVLVPGLGSQSRLSVHPYFDGLIRVWLNRPGDFHGPNCYSTALIASGIYSVDKIRYVSPKEFEAVLENNFSRIQAPKFQDIVVFDAESSRGHSGYYLGDELVFHKKSFSTHYHYRITTLSKVGEVESGEWRPGPMDDSSQQMNWPELGHLPKAFYRLKTHQLPAIDAQYTSLIEQLDKMIVQDMKSWAIGKKWGMMGEYVLEDLHRKMMELKVSDYSLGVMESLKDQLYIMIEEMYFRNARNPSRVVSDLCLPENKQQLIGVIKSIAKVFKKSETTADEIIKRMLEQDVGRCSFRPLNELWRN